MIKFKELKADIGGITFKAKSDGCMMDILPITMIEKFANSLNEKIAERKKVDKVKHVTKSKKS
jgi:hypothetical protein